MELGARGVILHLVVLVLLKEFGLRGSLLVGHLGQL